MHSGGVVKHAPCAPMEPLGTLNGKFLTVRLPIGEDDLISYFMNNIMGERMGTG